MLAAGGAAYAFVGGGNSRTQKRMASVGQQKAVGTAATRNAVDNNQQRRKNVQVLLKELEKAAGTEEGQADAAAAAGAGRADHHPRAPSGSSAPSSPSASPPSRC